MVDVAGKQVPKWAVTLGVLLVVGVVASNLSRCAGDKIASERAKNAASRAAEPKPAPQALPAFKVVKVVDAHAGATPRFDYRVVVSGKPTPEQLAQIAEAVFGQAKAKQPFSALAVRFYDFPEYATREFTLGQVQYAPEGDWAKASTIKPGDYDSMKATTDLPTKDWSKQLTADEVKVWAAWWAEYDAAAKAIGPNPGKMVDEAAVTSKVAKSTGKTSAEIKAILVKQQVWASQ